MTEAEAEALTLAYREARSWIAGRVWVLNRPSNPRDSYMVGISVGDHHPSSALWTSQWCFSLPKTVANDLMALRGWVAATLAEARRREARA